MSDAPSVEQLVVENAALRAENAVLRAESAEVGQLRGLVATLTERVAELERAVAADSSNSSRPPSSDAPWAKQPAKKQPAKKRSSRTRSGRRPGKQPGASSSSSSLIDDPDERLTIIAGRCRSCDASLAGAAEHDRQRRQVVDVRPAPPKPTSASFLTHTLMPMYGLWRAIPAATFSGLSVALGPVFHVQSAKRGFGALISTLSGLNGVFEVNRAGVGGARFW